MTWRGVRGLGLAVFAAAALIALGHSRAAPPPSRLAELPGARAGGALDVDVELVLAVDVSYSMDPEELALQREGYVEALTSPEFLNALKQGIHGRVAIAYFEWASAIDQKLVLPWRMIDGEASAREVAAQINRAPIRRLYRTSISGALTFAAALFDENGFRGMRRVIDVSGDGTNNQGPPVAITRDEVLAKGMTINGLPIMLKRPNPSTLDIPNLDVYYEDCVIGGPGAFVVPIQEREKFRDAIRTKLVLEVAQPHIAPRVIPAAVQRATADAPRISCTIGERMWQQRWGGSLDR
jgi:uncharacterized protein DUF1194